MKSNYVYVRPHKRNIHGKTIWVRGYYRRYENDNDVETGYPKADMIEDHLVLFPAGTVYLDPYRLEPNKYIAYVEGEIEGKNFIGMSWFDVGLNEAKFSDIDFQNGTLEGGKWNYTTFDSSGFRNAILYPESIDEVQFNGCNLSGAYLTAGRKVKNVDFSFNRANGLQIDFETGSTDGDFSFTGNVFNNAEYGKDYSGSEEKNYEKDVEIKIGERDGYAGNVEFTSNQMPGAEITINSYFADLSANNFKGAKLYMGGSFHIDQSNLEGATIIADDISDNDRFGMWDGDLQHDIIASNAKNAVIEGDWRGAYFKDTDFRGAKLSGDFRNVDFMHADLRGADLRMALLDGSNINDAVIDKTTLLPKGMEWLRNGNKVWENDPDWQQKRYAQESDPVFEEKALNFDIEAIRPLGAGTSPVQLVKLCDDGKGVLKNVSNRPSDTMLRPNEDESHRNWRIRVNSRHNGTNEIIGYRLSKLLGLDVVPDTVLTHNKDGRGVTIQKFLENSDVWSNAKMDYMAWPGEVDSKNAGKIQLLDVLMHNRDRHGGNLMIRTDGTRLWAIDFGHALPELGGEKNTMIRLDGNDPDMLILNELGDVFVDNWMDSVPEYVWDTIRSLTEDDFYKAFSDIKDDESFISMGGNVKLKNIWKTIEKIKAHKGEIY